MDRFYTKDNTLKTIYEIIMKNNFMDGVDLLVDFSAGDNRFCKMFDIQTESYDILPFSKEILQRDWFAIDALVNKYKKLAVGLNPPFGYMGKIAKQFVEHAVNFEPEFLFLIVPRSFSFRIGYSVVLEENLDENAFFDPQTGKDFCFPTKFLVLKKYNEEKYVKAEKVSKPETPRNFSIRVAGPINPKTQMLIRRAGVYANDQFYCMDGKRVLFMDRGEWRERDWIQNNHSVQEGGDATKYHSSSNPKRKKQINKNSITGWSWYKVDFDHHLSMDELQKLAEFIKRNPPKSIIERSKDISVLAKSSPPNINTTHLYPVFDLFFNK